MATLKRDQLLAKAETAAPALLDHDVVPVWQHFLFTGSRVMAYNDKIAISAPLKTDFKGTVPGKILIDTLKIVSHAESVELARSNGSAKITAGKTKVSLQSYDPEHFRFEMPAAPKEAAEVKDEFFTAIDNCLQATDDKGVLPDHIGITFIPDKGRAKLYSTNQKGSMIGYNRVTLAPQAGLKARVIVPLQFCQEMLRIGKTATKKRFALQPNSVTFIGDDVMLFSKLVASEKGIAYEAAVAKHMPKSTVKLDERLRPRIKVALELASRICDIKGNEVKTKIVCAKNVMAFTSESPRGQASDQVNIKHPDVSVAIRADMINAVYDRYENLIVTPSCAVLSNGEDSVYIVAAGNR